MPASQELYPCRNLQVLHVLVAGSLGQPRTKCLLHASLFAHERRQYTQRYRFCVNVSIFQLSSTVRPP